MHPCIFRQLMIEYTLTISDLRGSDDVLPIYLAELNTQEDKDKFAELYEKYSRKMYHIALSILKNPVDAEDAVDIVFSRLANKFTEISQKSVHDFEGYLVISIRNVSFTLLDKRNTYDKNTVDIDDVTEELTDFVLEETSNEVLDSALERLPSIHKDVITLYYFYDYSCAEIANILGIREITARKRLSNARKALKNLMKGAKDNE